MTDLGTAEQNDRESALYAAVRMTTGDERFSAGEVIDLAEYIRTGARGLPLDHPGDRR